MSAGSVVFDSSVGTTGAGCFFVEIRALDGGILLVAVAGLVTTGFALVCWLALADPGL